MQGAEFRLRAEEYLKKYHIGELFEELMLEVYRHSPSDPRAFLKQYLNSRKSGPKGKVCFFVFIYTPWLFFEPLFP